MVKLSNNQKRRIADILTDTGKIIFAASVIAPIFQEAKISIYLVITGIGVSVCVYLLAILLEKEI